MRQYTTPLQTMFVQGYELTESDKVYVTYADKTREHVLTVTDPILTHEDDGTTVKVHLTQEQTGLFAANEIVSVQVNWINEDGERMATNVANITCRENLLKEVIDVWPDEQS